MMFTSDSNVKRLMLHFREEFCERTTGRILQFECFSCFMAREGYSFVYNFRYTVNSIYFQYIYTSVGSQAERILGCQDGPL